MEVKRFSADDENIWDKFVEESVNGTFLQMRKFLNYHEKGRFMDFSLMVYDEKQKIVAVCPSCCIQKDNEKVFYSHRGSTFGGTIISEKAYKVEKVIEICSSIEKFLKDNSFTQCYYKITSDLFCVKKSDLLRYILYYLGYQNCTELNFYVDLDKNIEALLKQISQGKRTHINACEREGYMLRKLETQSEIEEFYNILLESLEKYSLKPVHTLEELIDINENRLQTECGFFGIYDKEVMIAGSMMFYFEKVMVAHTQYLCAKKEYSKQSVMTYLYYRMMISMKELGYKKISWGIATEHEGKIINLGLAKSKESFGSECMENYIFNKVL